MTTNALTGNRQWSCPLVSVIVPAYNAERFIDTCVRSVLAQSMRDLECIVVDDGSTDRTADAVQRIVDQRLRLVRKVNRGTVSDARNLGLSAARGTYVAFLDADDCWLPEKLERQIILHRAQPDLGLVYCGYATTDATLSKPKTMVMPEARDHLRGQVLLEASGIGFSSTALIPRAVLSDVGAFNVTLSTSADIDLAERIARKYPIAPVRSCLTLYRLHSAQGHNQLQSYEHDMCWILDDRFGHSGSVDRRAWRRGRANLYTRLAIYHGRRRRLRQASNSLMAAIRHGPDRVIALPIAAIVRRTRGRVALRHERGALKRSLRASLGR